MGSRKFSLVRLHFEAPLHLSLGKDQYEEGADILHSDTIAAAVTASVASLYGPEKAGDRSFQEALCFSSGAPFGKDPENGEVYYLFPRPLAQLDELPLNFGEHIEEAQAAKRLKKTRWVDLDLFNSLLEGRSVDIDPSEQPMESMLFSDPGSLSEDLFPLWRSEVHQRVNLPEEGEEGDSMPFYFERKYFREGAGLFLLYETPKDQETERMIRAALLHLGDQGIGSYRNIGNGRFIPEFDELTLSSPEDAASAVNLSLYCPSKGLEEELLKRSSYKLLKRGGYISSPRNETNIRLRKRSVFMFGEGSVFPMERPTGTVHDLVPKDMGLEHPVWRNGQCISLPINSIKR